ncbi:t-SNARE [Trichodelitschia bisporula]|uniref:t-SNARE n=1 Tax=Trichodelitschia bisporula TaxID=703511 RepID=A0A6G1I3R2_9PEZI|nr:t-SNARE [Trichodelitschia bisporula]
MSYGGGGYGSGYGQQNPYAQNNYGEGGRGYTGQQQQGGYSGAGYGQQQQGGYDQDHDVEMHAYGAAPGANAGNPNAILDDCQAIDRGIEDLGTRLAELQGLHNRVINDRAGIDSVDRMNTDIMAAYRGLGDKLKRVKSHPESGSPRNAPQVGRVDRRLKKAINDYQTVESDFRKKMREQQARQLRIVDPSLSETQAMEIAAEGNQTSVFMQALVLMEQNMNRAGQSQTTLNAVRARHEAIQHIERTMIELAQLFQDLETMVVQQDPLVENIEQKGEEIQENIVKANEQLDMGVKSARGARRKKWICFWIVVVVIIIVAIAVGVYVAVNKPSSNKSSPGPTVTATVTPTKQARAAVAMALPTLMARVVGGLPT